MFSSLKIYLIIGVVFVCMIGGFVAYYKDSQNTIRQQAKEIATLNIAVEEQKKAIEAMQADAKKQAEINQELQTKYNNSRNEIEILRNKFASLNSVARTRPTYAENKVNRATATVNRCFEIISGKTQQEMKLDDTQYKEVISRCGNISRN